MNSWMKVALAAAIVGGLGAILATIWVGSKVREETVVASPYEDGLRHATDRAARDALGWEVEVAPAFTAVPSLPFSVRDRAGRPVAGARVTVSAERPDTSRGVRTFDAQDKGEGAYLAPVGGLEPGPWVLRFDVRRGTDRVRLERSVRVGAACDVGAAPCTLRLDGGGEVTLDLGPRPIRTMTDLAVTVEVRGAGGEAPSGGGGATEEVTVAFAMTGMAMGRNEVRLAPSGAGRHAGTAVLVRCPSGRRDWIAEVRVASPGRTARSARFPLLAEE